MDRKKSYVIRPTLGKVSTWSSIFFVLYVDEILDWYQKFCGNKLWVFNCLGNLFEYTCVLMSVLPNSNIFEDYLDEQGILP